MATLWVLGAGRGQRGVAGNLPPSNQTLAVNSCRCACWNFHRLMLGQHGFYQDELPGLTTKVMQTALAVRDTLFVLADVRSPWRCMWPPWWCWRARLTCG
jgi:hypothetical protein